MFKIVTLSFCIFFVSSSYTNQESSKAKAKEYYFGALTFYDEKNYDNALFSLKKAENHLGKTNARIEGLAVKILFAQNKKEEAQERIAKYYQQLDIKLVPKLEREVASIKIKIEESSNLTTNVNMSFEDTLSYIQKNLNGIPQNHKTLDYPLFKEQKGTLNMKNPPMRNVQSTYELSLQSYCNFILTVETIHINKTERDNIEVSFDLARIPYITQHSANEEAFTPNNAFSFKLWEKGNYIEQIDKARKLKIMKITTNGHVEYFPTQRFPLESKNTVKRLASAFKNLKATCPKDPFS